jgi:excinuclease ABC subunit B
VAGQVDDLLGEIRIRARRGERVLVTVMTKRMAEDLSDYLAGVGVRVRYMHSDIDAIERIEIVRGLRLGEFDVLVGINLLREGLDLPEVSLVAVLDADRMTNSMTLALEEMDRRRTVQRAFNLEHGITPTSIVKSVEEIRISTRVADAREDPVPRSQPLAALAEAGSWAGASAEERAKILEALEQEMRAASDDLDFELAAQIRDQIMDLKAGKQSPNRSGTQGGKGYGRSGRGSRARR